MRRLLATLRKASNINTKAFMFQILNEPEIKKAIIEANLSQLREGFDSEGNVIGTPSPSTARKNARLGFPSDKIVLFASGEFYDSFMIQITSDTIKILSDPIKDAETDLTEKYGKDIIGIQPEKQALLNELIAARIRQELRQQIPAK